MGAKRTKNNREEIVSIAKSSRQFKLDLMFSCSRHIQRCIYTLTMSPTNRTKDTLIQELFVFFFLHLNTKRIYFQLLLGNYWNQVNWPNHISIGNVFASKHGHAKLCHFKSTHIVWCILSLKYANFLNKRTDCTLCIHNYFY